MHATGVVVGLGVAVSALAGTWRLIAQAAMTIQFRGTIRVNRIDLLHKMTPTVSYVLK